MKQQSIAKKDKAPVTKKVKEAKPESTSSGEIAVFPAKTEAPDADLTKKFDKEAKELFDQHPSCAVLHFSSDGLAFFELCDARNHASTLVGKEVITKVRKK